MQAAQRLEAESWELGLDVVRQQGLTQLPDLAPDRVSCMPTTVVLATVRDMRIPRN